jgi:hypothetical protein
MSKGRAICVALLGLAGAVVTAALMLHDHVSAAVLGGPANGYGFRKIHELKIGPIIFEIISNL